jgi:hypothetical protein
VEGARPSDAAIERSELPATTPRDISSRSANVNDSLDRFLGDGGSPPIFDNMPWMDE